MCFSASASFSVGAALAPVGIYCCLTAQRIGSKWVPLAVFPVAFSLQQTIEGLVWFGVNSADQTLVVVASRGFLFFSHFFWLAWVPFSIYWLESEIWRRRILLCLTGVGVASGASVFLPSFLMADWLTVEQVQHSLEYKTVLIYDGLVSRTVLRAIYAVIIVSALLMASSRQIRVFGGLILLSLLVADHFFAHALISVWCFFAAVLSIHIAIILAIESNRRAAKACD